MGILFVLFGKENLYEKRLAKSRKGFRRWWCSSLTDVMVAQQKASVSFQATLQVRNKLVEAYKDVMNMPM